MRRTLQRCLHGMAGGETLMGAPPSGRAQGAGRDLVHRRKRGRPDAAPVAAQRVLRHQRWQPPHLHDVTTASTVSGDAQKEKL